MTEALPTDRALSGIRVLDFSIMMAGPYCSRLLADLGAEVIKIEPPEGDDMRLRLPMRQGHSAYFGQLNAGKKSLALDLKHPDSIALVKQLVLQADVVLENFRPGVMERLGLGAGTLRALNPRLVYAAISGYGQSGPLSQKAAYAMIVQAESGFERMLAEYAGDRDRPAPTATFVADVLGGIYAFGAIQAALVQRARTGQGQVVDVALMDCMLNLLIYELQEAQFPVKARRAAYGPVAAKDGDVLVVPLTQRNHQALCDITQLPVLREDPRFATVPSRSANWGALMHELQAWTRPRPVAEVLTTLEAAGVPCARYNSPADALQDEQLQQRGLFAEVLDGGGSFKGVNAPWQMSAGGSRLGERVPAVGEHAEGLLRSVLGLDAAAIATLRASGALAPQTPRLAGG